MLLFGVPVALNVRAGQVVLFERLMHFLSQTADFLALHLPEIGFKLLPVLLLVLKAFNYLDGCQYVVKSGQFLFILQINNAVPISQKFYQLGFHVLSHKLQQRLFRLLNYFEQLLYLGLWLLPNHYAVLVCLQVFLVIYDQVNHVRTDGFVLRPFLQCPAFF